MIDLATTQVEQEMGEVMADNVKKEVANKVVNMIKKKQVTQFEVIKVCRELYRRRM